MPAPAERHTGTCDEGRKRHNCRPQLLALVREYCNLAQLNLESDLSSSPQHRAWANAQATALSTAPGQVTKNAIRYTTPFTPGPLLILDQVSTCTLISESTVSQSVSDQTGGVLHTFSELLASFYSLTD